MPDPRPSEVADAEWRDYVLACNGWAGQGEPHRQYWQSRSGDPTPGHWRNHMSKKTYRYWTTKEDAMLRKRYPHESTAAIAAELVRTPASVYNRAIHLGLTKTPECRRRVGEETSACATL